MLEWFWARSEYITPIISALLAVLGMLGFGKLADQLRDPEQRQRLAKAKAWQKTLAVLTRLAIEQGWTREQFENLTIGELQDAVDNLMWQKAGEKDNGISQTRR